MMVKYHMSTCQLVIYQLKVVLQGISPMIWRRLLVCGDSTIADLHYIVQIAMGWSGDHLHIMDRLLEIIEEGGSQDYHQEELEALHFWFHIDCFDRKEASRRFYDYVRGENVFAWA